MKSVVSCKSDKFIDFLLDILYTKLAHFYKINTGKYEGIWPNKYQISHFERISLHHNSKNTRIEKF